MSHPETTRKPRTFFVTSATWERRSLFQTERMARLFLEVLVSYRAKGNYLLHEFVLMPDHFHALLTLSSRISLEKAMQLIKGGFSFRARKELEFAAEIWARGFSDEFITSELDFRTRLQYIRRNPVRAGLAQAPGDFPYGSAGSGIEMDPMPDHLRG